MVLCSSAGLHKVFMYLADVVLFKLRGACPDEYQGHSLQRLVLLSINSHLGKNRQDDYDGKALEF
jgi:hypothetical protein